MPEIHGTHRAQIQLIRALCAETIGALDNVLEGKLNLSAVDLKNAVPHARAMNNWILDGEGHPSTREEIPK